MCALILMKTRVWSLVLTGFRFQAFISFFLLVFFPSFDLSGFIRIKSVLSLPSSILLSSEGIHLSDLQKIFLCLCTCEYAFVLILSISQ